MFWKLEEVSVGVYKILHYKEMGYGWTAWSLFQNKHYRVSDKAKSKINKRTWISMQQGSTSALWVQKLNNNSRKTMPDFGIEIPRRFLGGQTSHGGKHLN